MKNLIFVNVSTFGFDAGGARIMALAQVLKPHFDMIQVVCPFPGREKKNPNLKVNNLSIKYLSFFSKWSSFLLVRILKVTVGLLRLYGYILFSTKKDDTLFFYNPTFFTTIPHIIFANKIGRKTVVDVVESYQHQKDTWYHRWGDRFAFKYASIPCAISKPLITYGQQYAQNTIFHLPIIVDHQRFQKEVKPDFKTMGYIGTSAPKDGLDLILEGFAVASKKDEDLKLKIIGPKPIYFDFDKKIEDLGIASQVQWTQTKSMDESVIELFRCDTFVMNRTGILFAQYGYPTKLGEYFACNRPVLMSDGPGFSEDFEDRVEAIKYRANNPQALADALMWRYENENRANEIAQRGYAYALQHFSKEVVGEIFVKTLREEGILK